MIDRTTIDRIMDAADIAEVVQDFVSIKKRGVNYIGCCPFHNEKTPSFIVSPAKGIYKCFGCGKSGNAVGFVMEHEQMTYPEALKYIARKYGIEVVEKELSPEEQQQNDDRESMRMLNEYAAKYFQNNLLNDPEGIAIGLSYFRERGFTDEAIKTFGLGYSLEKRDAFTEQALRDGYKLDFMTRTGLTIVNEETKRRYDRFFGRVMFPVYSISGQVIGFGGRILKTAEKTAKYVNSPESEIYNKSKTLYGLYQARTEIVRQKKCYLVEGYADVISLYMAGVHNVVASSGTSLTEDQIRIIHRLTDDITVLYDGDSAGIHASIRGIDMLLAQGLNVRVLLLPDGEDPDSFAKKYGSEKTIEYLNTHEEDFIRFKTRLSKTEADKDPLKRAAMITDIVRTISVIEDQIKQTVYLQECSKILEIDENTLYSELMKIRRKKIMDGKSPTGQTFPSKPEPKLPEPKQVPTATGNKEIGFLSKEHEIIRILLLYGNKEINNPLDHNRENPQRLKAAELLVALMLKANITELRNKVNQQIFKEIINAVINGRDISEKEFINSPDPAISSVAADACASSYELSKMWEKHGSTYYKEENKLGEIITDVYRKYVLEIRKDEKKRLSAELKAQMETGKKLKSKLATLEANWNSEDENQSEEIEMLKKESAENDNKTIEILKKINAITQEIKDLSITQGRVTI
ncbi:MAG: DNA primase [Bacteroidales bacterium]|nr:DNA primase [Bacteroidales bacterium]MBO7572756.1 DNA primase [Bacteroidales bacterium]